MIPVEIQISYTDGSIENVIWEVSDLHKVIEVKSSSPVESVVIDPEQKLLIDVNLNNNSYTGESNSMTVTKYFSRALYWTQNMVQSITALM